MEPPILKSDVYTDFQGLNALRARARQDGGDEQTLREVAGQFEALFIQMMLKSMRDASLGDGLMDSEQTRQYQAMYDRQISLELASGGGLGLAEVLVRQLRGGASTPEVPDGPAPEATPTTVGDRASVASASPEPATPKQTPADWRPDSPRAFVQGIWSQAEQVSRRLGIPTEALVAQAALETGWGRHMIRDEQGRNSFNFFGIKAGPDWQGARVATDTLEFRDGIMRREHAWFRAYASPQEAFADYADFLARNPRYREVLEQGNDAHRFASALSRAGYATDPAYADKLHRILDSGILASAAGGDMT
ncbi:MAG TPA: flagellar assembly peptidoglycan hydrolase FlgJ [Gammaproteobacteria bacterium]|nr:flagellar assembly peptidoglycan hydrolase FlgJ [Gammaproteobacteria bacterium]